MTASLPVAETADIAGRQTLADAMSRGSLPLPRALACAARIASELRDMHARGLAHGTVGATTVHLTADGAHLAPSLAYPGEHTPQRDVQAFGAVLQEMLAGAPIPIDAHRAPFATGPEKGPLSVLPAARRLARKCLARPPERLLSMQQAYTEVRLLAVLARQYHLDCNPPAPKPPAEPAVTATPQGPELHVARPDSGFRRWLSIVNPRR